MFKEKQTNDLFYITLMLMMESLRTPFFLGGRSMTTWTRKGWQVVKKCLFLSTFRVKNVHVEVGGGQKEQNCVHVVIECPLIYVLSKLGAGTAGHSTSKQARLKWCHLSPSFINLGQLKQATGENLNFVFINSGELIVAAKRSNYSQPCHSVPCTVLQMCSKKLKS